MSRLWRARNPEANLASVERWKVNHPELVRLHDQKKRAMRKGAPGHITRAEWQTQLAWFGHCCAYCGDEATLTMDHVTALSRGGAHVIENVVPACGPCNLKKHARGILAMVNVQYETHKEAA